MGTLAKGNLAILDLSRLEDQLREGNAVRDFHTLWRACSKGRMKSGCDVGGGFIRWPPLTPEAFATELETKAFTSKKADLQAVADLYERAFTKRLAAAEELRYQGLGWGDAEAVTLSHALHAAHEVYMLLLQDNEIGDAGVRALAASLRAGAAPKLTSIFLGRNPAGAAAVQELKEARAGLDVVGVS